MASWKTYTVTTDNMVMNANITKQSLLAALESEGLLKETAEEIGKKYVVVLHTKGRFGSWFDKLFGVMDDDDMALRVMKVINYQ